MKISVATKITIFSFAALCISATSIFSYKPIPVSFTSPKGWPAPTYNFKSNPLTKEGITLGKKLFYDAALSSDSSVSCASCHEPSAAFATYDHPLSHGVNNLTTRNAPSLFNLAWQKELMLDGRAKSLEAQALLPLHSIDEMDANIPDLLKRLNANPGYKKMFTDTKCDNKPQTMYIDATPQFNLMYKVIPRFPQIFTPQEMQVI